MDLVARTPRLPLPGESLPGHEFYTAPGGKGACQATALARLGVATKLIGRVGGDEFGTQLIAALRESGVDVGGIMVDQETTSGVAMISVDDTSENSIVVVAGANGRVGESDLARLEPALDDATFLLLQLEIPLDATVAAARLAWDRGVPTIFDPAPARPLPDEIYGLVTIITPNQVEAEQMVGFAVETHEDGLRAARTMVDRGVPIAIVKMGSLGAVYVEQTEAGRTEGIVPAFAITPVDTVAAGDAFNGGLTAALTEGHSLEEALRWASAAGALSTTRPGAIPSLPTRAEFEAFLREH
jgi:ribokinase